MPGGSNFCSSVVTLEGPPASARPKTEIEISAVIIGNCWRCEMPGHVAVECQPDPPETRQELQARIDRYVERWQEFEITTAQKRQWIAAENKSFDKEKARKAA